MSWQESGEGGKDEGTQREGGILTHISAILLTWDGEISVGLAHSWSKVDPHDLK